MVRSERYGSRGTSGPGDFGGLCATPDVRKSRPTQGRQGGGGNSRLGCRCSISNGSEDSKRSTMDVTPIGKHERRYPASRSDGERRLVRSRRMAGKHHQGSKGAPPSGLMMLPIRQFWNDSPLQASPVAQSPHRGELSIPSLHVALTLATTLLSCATLPPRDTNAAADDNFVTICVSFFSDRGVHAADRAPAKSR